MRWEEDFGDVQVAEESDEQQGGAGFNSAWAAALQGVAADAAGGAGSDEGMSCASAGSRPSDGGR